MPRKKSLPRFLRNNGLSLCMFGLFLIFLIGLSITGHVQSNEMLQSHSKAPQTYLTYVSSGEFVEAVFENWESEFLQMATLVIATIFLRQKGSTDSKKVRGKESVDTSSRYAIIHATSWRTRRKGLRELLEAHSLGLSLIALFVLSFALHAFGGVAAYNEDAALHGESQLSTLAYVGSTTFWFESFQNWQSEFLAVGTLLVLSIFLRERGSPESKAVGDPNHKTGE